GSRVTKGLGCGGNPEIGRRAAEEDREVISEIVEGADMIFLAAGMGGGTGTGACPVVAEISKRTNALTVAIVTKPFLFEGKKRMAQAEQGIEELKRYVDTVIAIPNQRLLQIAPKDLPMLDAFALADDVLLRATQGISDLIAKPGEINLDFADVKTIMSEMGNAVMGTASARGEGRAREAAIRALTNPLLDDVTIAGAKGILINITGGRNMTLAEVAEAASAISETAGPEANVIFGTAIDEDLTDEVRITVIATGIGIGKNQKEAVIKEAQEKVIDQNALFQNTKRREVFEIDDATRLPLNPVSGIDLDTPAFIRRHSE
ncbi:MAG: cell division protein FtsZ, partial [bacterium]